MRIIIGLLLGLTVMLVLSIPAWMAPPARYGAVLAGWLVGGGGMGRFISHLALEGTFRSYHRAFAERSALCCSLGYYWSERRRYSSVGRGFRSHASFYLLCDQKLPGYALDSGPAWRRLPIPDLWRNQSGGRGGLRAAGRSPLRRASTLTIIDITVSEWACRRMSVRDFESGSGHGNGPRPRNIYGCFC